MKRLFVLISVAWLLLAAVAWADSVDVKQTGQTKCYDKDGAEVNCAGKGSGQDGDLRAGAAWPAPRFVSGTGAEANCVTDKLTGLMWPKDGNINNKDVQWNAALEFTAGLNSSGGLCGYTDWRLPNVNELASLINDGVYSLSEWLNSNGFTKVVSGGYWTSTTKLANSGYAYDVSMQSGYILTDPKAMTNYVLPVRSGQAGSVQLPKTGASYSYFNNDDGFLKQGSAWPAPRFAAGAAAEADCITDNMTGLMWVRNPDSLARNWTDALDYANGLALCGYTDWRLPNRNELRSLIHYGQADTSSWLNTEGFSNISPKYYWTSTTDANNTYYVWKIAMDDADVAQNNRSDYNLVLPVRSGRLNAPETLVRLTVTSAGSGGGSIISSPSGISCDSMSSCSTLWKQGTVITLMASNDSGSEFKGWSGGGCSGTAVCTLTLSSETTVTANFEKTYASSSCTAVMYSLSSSSFKHSEIMLRVPLIKLDSGKYYAAIFIYTPTLDGSHMFQLLMQNEVTDLSSFGACPAAVFTGSDARLSIPELVINTTSYSLELQYVPGWDSEVYLFKVVKAALK